MKIKKSLLKIKDFKEMQFYIFDDSCECNDNFDRYGVCCGKEIELGERVFYFNWNKPCHSVRFKNILENIQDKILKFYHEQHYLILTRGHLPYFKKFIK